MKKIFLAFVCGLAFLCCGWIFQPIATVGADAQTTQGSTNEQETLTEDLETNIAEENAQTETTNEADEPNAVVIRGDLLWMDNNSNLHPLIFTKVNIVFDDRVKEVETYTSAKGSFFYICKDYFEYEEVHIEIYSVNEGATVEVRDINDDLYVEILDPQPIEGFKVQFPYLFAMNTTKGQAFQVLQAATVAAKYVECMEGEALPMVTVVYPYGAVGDDYCEYRKQENKILLSYDRDGLEYLFSYESWDIIMHEYGHHVAYCYEVAQESSGDEHSLKQDLNNQHGKYIGCSLAWSEGLATIFGAMAQEYYVENLSQDSNPIVGVADDGYTSHRRNVFVPYETYDGDYGGEGNELTIMRILWDLYDEFNYNSPANEEDRFALGDELFDKLYYSEAQTFSDFVNYFTSDNSNVNATRNLAYILDQYKIAPSNLVWIPHNATPSLSWIPNGGKEERYKNNQFSLCFYDDYGDMSYTIENLNANSNRITIAEDGRWQYTLTNDQWKNVLYTYGTSFEVSVLGYQISTDLDQEGMPVNTGGYMSVALTVQKPISTPTVTVSLDVQVNYFERVVSLTPGSYICFDVVWELPQRKIIQTFGTVDTILEIYDSEGTLLVSDDDSGYESNAFINYQVEHGKQYTVKLFCAVNGTYGTTKLAIIPMTSSTPTIMQYEDFTTFRGTVPINKLFAIQNYNMNAFIFIPGKNGVHRIEMELPNREACFYIIDPRESNVLLTDYQYAEASGVGGTAILNVNLKQGIPYLIVYGGTDLKSGYGGNSMRQRIFLPTT